MGSKSYDITYSYKRSRERAARLRLKKVAILNSRKQCTYH